ncbi:hypothetical protein DM02DRAFT_650343 [Periconia macrospinosa]|uniref:Xylanolytic transcriptional activator regulatory domain-containing protein n=1 Tax=Periconia macrospinosa TaxID=97972 RepID=A0A2V1E5P4_9PLEO|nr:hypothetical protein DM02DRAFT_650343 [Periconia macrospinosa]
METTSGWNISHLLPKSQSLGSTIMETHHDKGQSGKLGLNEPARTVASAKATEQNSRLLALLRELSPHVDDEGQILIHDYLDTDEHSLNLHPLHDDVAPPSKRARDDSPGWKQNRNDGPGRASDSDQVDGRHLDRLDEDLLRTSKARATGFIGVNSSMQWLRSLRTQMRDVQVSTDDDEHRTNDDTRGGNDRTRSRQQSHKLNVSDSTFYLDCDDLDLDDLIVDPFELPPPEVLNHLFDCYMQTTHSSFQILPTTFEDQFRRYSQSLKIRRPCQVSNEWLAMLNLVLAIGRQYLHLTQSNIDSPNPLVFIARATQLLRLDKIATSLPSPTLSFIQSLGLLSLCSLTIGQVSRAWMLIGIALRYALAAGLHLRNDDTSASSNKNEVLVNTWWSLHSIESLLCTIIGRPCIISDEECTVPLPQSSDSPSPQPGKRSQNSSRHGSDADTSKSMFGAWVTVALIMQKALSRLYSPRIIAGSWHKIQEDITSLMRELDKWAVHARLMGQTEKGASEVRMHRNDQLLAFHYLSAKILICRPCLCRLKGHGERNDTLVELTKEAAGACVSAALAMTRLLPDQPDRLQTAYFQTPWWAIIHNIMQAVAVLLLKLSLGPSHAIHDGEMVVNSVKKLVRWLRFFNSTSHVAERAYKIVADIIQVSASRGHINVRSTPDTDTPTTDPTGSSNSQTTTSVSSPGSSAMAPPRRQPQSSQQSTVREEPFLDRNQQKLADPGPPPQTGTMEMYGDYMQNPYANSNTHMAFNPEPSQYVANDILAENFMTQPDLSMPMYFSNPFFTHFDQSNLIFDEFAANMDGNANADTNMNVSYESFQDQGPNA